MMPDGVHRRHTAQKLYRTLAGLAIAKDIVVVTENDVREHVDNPFLVLYLALAIHLDGQMVTEDRRLYDGLTNGPLAKHILWVEDIS